MSQHRYITIPLIEHQDLTDLDNPPMMINSMPVHFDLWKGTVRMPNDFIIDIETFFRVATKAKKSMEQFRMFYEHKKSPR